MAAGYSGTPLEKKLGVKDGQRTWHWKMPESVLREILASGVRPEMCAAPKVGLEMAHIFVTDRKELAGKLGRLRGLLAADGTIWVSWPKKSSGVTTDVDEHGVRETGLEAGLVDVKVCAVTDVWSGLKFVRRVKDRKK